MYIKTNKRIYSSSSSKVWAAIRSKSLWPFSEILLPPLAEISKTPIFSKACKDLLLMEPEASACLWGLKPLLMAPPYNLFNLPTPTCFLR